MGYKLQLDFISQSTKHSLYSLLNYVLENIMSQNMTIAKNFNDKHYFFLLCFSNKNVYQFQFDDISVISK